MIRELVQFEYRSMVIRQLQVTVGWQQIEWFRPGSLFAV